MKKKRKRIDLEKLGKPKRFGPYSIKTKTGYQCFFVEATNHIEADELAFKKADELKDKNTENIVDTTVLEELIDCLCPN